jgi:hypothetical protein
MNADWGMGLTLTPRRDLAMIAIQGPNATQALNEALPGVDQITATSSPSTPPPWARCSSPAPATPARTASR